MWSSCRFSRLYAMVRIAIGIVLGHTSESNRAATEGPPATPPAAEVAYSRASTNSADTVACSGYTALSGSASRSGLRHFFRRFSNDARVIGFQVAACIRRQYRSRRSVSAAEWQPGCGTGAGEHTSILFVLVVFDSRGFPGVFVIDALSPVPAGWHGAYERYRDFLRRGASRGAGRRVWRRPVGTCSYESPKNREACSCRRILDAIRRSGCEYRGSPAWGINISDRPRSTPRGCPRQRQ